MNELILKELFEKETINSSVSKKLGVASYTYQKTVDDLYWLGVITKNKSKLNISLLDNPISGTLKKLFFEGFNTKLLSKKNLEWFSNLIEPRTTLELAELNNQSISQTNQLLNKFSGFITKKKNFYTLSKTNQELFTLITLTKMNQTKNYVWRKGEEKIEKIPLNFEPNGTLTGFSRFTEHGLMINPSHNYVYFPKKELTLEEILVHAIKFSDNPNDLTLCILFYMKNKARVKVKKIEKNCKKFEILNTWFDIINYVENHEPKNPALFLPKNEFQQKIKLYNLELASRYHQELIQKFFKKISKELKEPITIYFIGGNALIEHKTKNSTKDIDIVITDKKQAKVFVKTLKKIGFTEIKKKENQYAELEASTILEQTGHPRIDLFTKKICGTLEFSKNMIKRSKQISQDNTRIQLATLEDIFLLKSVSSRDSDLIDCENILQKNVLNWKIIYDEIIAQEKNFENNQEFTILEHLEALEQRMNITIPITKKIITLCIKKSVLVIAKNPVTIKEIKQKIDFPDTTIRNHVIKLIKQKKLKKITNKPLQVQKNSPFI